MATTAAATGRLMKKTSRQDTALISQPPRNGPIAVATPPSPDQAPMALERSSGANDAWRIARLPGVEQRGARPLHRPGRDQEPGVRRQAAGERREREPHRADHEDLPAAVDVAERAAEQQQAGQRQRVAVDDPLHAGHGGVEVPADRGQRDADHGGVERGDARPEHRGREHPPPGGGSRTAGRAPRPSSCRPSTVAPWPVRRRASRSRLADHGRGDGLCGAGAARPGSGGRACRVSRRLSIAPATAPVNSGPSENADRRTRPASRRVSCLASGDPAMSSRPAVHLVDAAAGRPRAEVGARPLASRCPRPAMP